MSPIERAIFKAGGVTFLAKSIGEKNYQTIQNWVRSGSVPPNKVILIEKATGIPRYELSPDLYPPEEYKKAS